TTHRGVGGDHRPIPGFPLDDRKGCHSHSAGWPWWILFPTFFRHDSYRRFGALDVEFVRTQQYLGFAGDAYRVVGLWNSQPGSYVHSHLQHRWVVSVLLHCAWGMLWYGRHSRRDVESDADSNSNSNSPAAR